MRSTMDSMRHKASDLHAELVRYNVSGAYALAVKLEDGSN